MNLPRKKFFLNFFYKNPLIPDLVQWHILYLIPFCLNDLYLKLMLRVILFQSALHEFRLCQGKFRTSRSNPIFQDLSSLVILNISPYPNGAAEITQWRGFEPCFLLRYWAVSYMK